MTERRFYIKDFEETGVIAGEEYRHVVKVLRLGVGDKIVVFCGDGWDYHSTITEINSSEVRVEVIKKEKNICEPQREVILFQAIPKGEKADFIVQKATELGLSEVVFFDSENTVKKQKDTNAARFSRIAIEAAKQCGRASVPRITTGLSFQQVLKRLQKYPLQLFANECEKGQNLRGILDSQIDKSLPVALITGSEGGFSKKEGELLVQNGAKSLTLGSRILRAETAAVALSAITMYLLGELE